MPVSGTPVTDMLEQYAELDEAFGELSQAYGELLEQVKFYHTLTSLLIEEQGGIVEVSKELADTYDGMKTVINMYESVDGAKFIIEVVERDDV